MEKNKSWKEWASRVQRIKDFANRWLKINKLEKMAFDYTYNISPIYYNN